jgi:hypothetical protein
MLLAFNSWVIAGSVAVWVVAMADHLGGTWPDKAIEQMCDPSMPG